MKKLLLIDDDPDLLELTAKRLKRKGYDVILSTSYTETKSFKDEEFHAIISDLFLGPDGNGLDILEFMRKNHFLGKFILATGDDTGDLRIAPLRQSDPSFWCLQKPFDLNTLTEILEMA